MDRSRSRLGLPSWMEAALVTIASLIFFLMMAL
jgi:hypothetical protein